jgi:DNA (cytosine-5)-methyltransferase 1
VDTRSFGLPQRRRRLYLLASLDQDPRSVLYTDDAGAVPDPPKSEWRSAACGFYWTEGLRGLGWTHDAVPTLKGGSTVGIPSPPAIVLPEGRIGVPDIRDAERLQGFEEDWTLPAEGVARRGFRWKLVGNAVTVDVAAWIGERLRRPGCYDESFDVPLMKIRAWPTSAYNVSGQRMMPTDLSEWPLDGPRRALRAFLNHDLDMLSRRAVTGFFGRANRGSLKFPPGFLRIVEQHC